MSEFHFLRPLYFCLFIPFLLLLIGLWRSKLSQGVWSKLCAPHLLPYILETGSAGRRVLPLALLFFTGAAWIIALAGPVWERVSLPLIQQKSGLVIALNLSPSMNAEDVKPTRLQRALYKVNDILQKRSEGQTAFLVYTDEAFVVTPLTDDVKTIKALLPVIDTSLMPTHGLNHEKAVEKGSELLRQGGITDGSILLIAADALAAPLPSEIPVSFLAVGTEQGAPIPKGGGGFVLDEKGGVIISKVDKSKMRKAAEGTGGRFALIAADDTDVQYLLDQKSGSFETQETEVKVLWKEWGYWLALLTLPFAAFFLRRGYLSLALVCLSTQLHADLWKNSDQRGAQLYAQEEYQEASQAFRDRKWQAASHYKAKNYEAAEKLYEEDHTADGYYNYGNSLAQQEKIDEAIAAYDKALELQPDHEDALHNKKLLEEQKQQQSQDNKDKQDQEKKQDKQDRQDKQDQDKQDQEDKQDKQDKQDQEEQEKQDQQDKEEQDKQEEKEEQMAESDPQKEIDNRWLQRIPDDPGGLLRRKFLYQYQKGRA